MKTRSRIEGNETKVLEEVLRKMVCYEPKDRISAEEAVRLIPESWLQSESELVSHEAKSG